MSTAAAPAETADVPPQSGKKKKLIIILAAVLVLALAGGGGTVYWLKKKAADAAAAAEAADDEGGAKPAHAAAKGGRRTPPLFLPLDPFVVNLADREADRFAQIGITLEVDDAKFAEEMKAHAGHSQRHPDGAGAQDLTAVAGAIRQRSPGSRNHA